MVENPRSKLCEAEKRLIWICSTMAKQVTVTVCIAIMTPLIKLSIEYLTDSIDENSFYAPFKDR